MNQAVTAAGITVPSTSRPINVDVVLHRIAQLLDSCGTSNRNDLVVVTIEALIEESVNTGPAIVGAAASIGFKRAHASVMLGTNEGGNPDRHRWQRGSDGIYRLQAAKLAP